MIIFYEGLGGYRGTAQDKKFHPKGRMGARVSVYHKGKRVFRTNNASTLPDSISASYAKKFNSGYPVPTTIEGVFDIYTKLHNGKYKAVELGKNSERIPVIREYVMSTSYAINMHYRKVSDYKTFAWSTGCLTVQNEDLQELFSILGIRTFSGQFVGKLIIDRSNLSKELANHYKEEYGECFNKFSSAIYKSSEQKIGEAAIENLAKKNLINNPKTWKNKDLTTNTPLWLFFELINRVKKVD